MVPKSSPAPSLATSACLSCYCTGHMCDPQLNWQQVGRGVLTRRELVVVYTDSLYTAYRAVLRGTIQVAVQVTKEPVGEN